MDHRYKHEKPTTLAGKVGVGMVELDKLNDADFDRAFDEYNQQAPVEIKFTKETMEKDKERVFNCFCLWYYEAKVKPLREKTIQN